MITRAELDEAEAQDGRAARLVLMFTLLADEIMKTSQSPEEYDERIWELLVNIAQGQGWRFTRDERMTAIRTLRNSGVIDRSECGLLLLEAQNAQDFDPRARVG